jgi:hypothetical protein
MLHTCTAANEYYIPISAILYYPLMSALLRIIVRFSQLIFHLECDKIKSYIRDMP